MRMASYEFHFFSFRSVSELSGGKKGESNMLVRLFCYWSKWYCSE